MQAEQVGSKPAYKSFRYFSKVAGSKFIMPDGKELFFTHGFHDLNEKDYIGDVFQPMGVQGVDRHPRYGEPTFNVYKDELDAMIKAGNPLLYVQGTQPLPLPSMGTDKNARSESEVIQQESVLQQAGARLTGEPNKGAQLSPNESTVDASLRDVVLATSPALQAARAAAAASVNASSNSNGSIQK